MCNFGQKHELQYLEEFAFYFYFYFINPKRR